MGDVFWDVATSTFALSIDGLVLLAALVVGYFPLLKYVPAIGPYVPAARLVAALVAALMCFLVGFRVSDERAEIGRLNATIAAQRADLNTAEKARNDANQRATDIEDGANAQRKADDEFISTLTLPADCGFEPFPGRVRDKAAAGAGVARPPAAPGSAHDGAASAGAGSELPVSVVRRRWLPWQRP